MVAFVRSQMIWHYILRSEGKGFGPAFRAAKEENEIAFQALLRIAYPLAYA